MSGIKLSPKYGVNPSMLQCFWCGEPYAIALMGRINPDHKRGRSAEDLEAPPMICMGYDPCPKCQEKFNAGVVLFEVVASKLHGEMPSVRTERGEQYPTGKFLVVRTEAWNNSMNTNFDDGQMIAVEEGVIESMLPKEG